MPHAGWYMPMYHFLGTYVIAGVTVAYALLACVRMRPRVRLTPKKRKAHDTIPVPED